MGREIVSTLAADGARVLAVDIDRNTAEATAAFCREKGHDVVAHQADICRPIAIQEMVAAAIKEFGRIDVLVNHAGSGSFRALTETDDEHWDHMIALNLTSAFLASREVMPHLLANSSGGVILNTISSAGLAGGRAGLAYTTAKHGMVGLTQNIAVSYGGLGIRCVGVCPGYVRSPLPDGVEAPTDNSYYGGGVASSLFEGIARLAAPKGRPADLAGVIAFLASDQAAFVNGAIIAVDGGFTAI